jgi:hypothetical protein
MSDKAREPDKRKGISGLVFAACFFVGMGISFATGTMPVGIFIGMGVGFAAMAIVRHRSGEW